MKKSKIIQALIVGIMSAIAVSLTLHLNLYTWVLFMAWVSFFVFGKEPKQMALTFAQIVLGMGIGILMMVKGHFLGGILGGFGPSIAIIVVMALLMYFVPNLKPINTIPAYFMGIIIFFGTHPELNVTEIGLILLTVITGFLFAWTTQKMEYIFVGQH